MSDMQLPERLYSVLRVTKADDDQRTIEGYATTPTIDKMGDVVEPLGAAFSLPVPLIWQHNHDEPVGNVLEAEPSEDGIRVKAHIPEIPEDGDLKRMVDKAWQSVKAGLVRGLSIGFRPTEWEPLKNKLGGLRFTEWDWDELSLVTIPANSDATIAVVRSAYQAASGRSSQLGVSGTQDKPEVSERKKMPERRKTIAEQIAEFQASREAKSAAMDEIMAKAADSGETLDEADSEAYDSLEGEVVEIDKHLARLARHQQTMAAKAEPVPENPDGAVPVERRAKASQIRVNPVQPEPGVRFARLVKALGVAQGQPANAVEVLAAQYPDDQELQHVMRAAAFGGGLDDMRVKAAVGSGTVADATWAGALVGAESTVFADFVEFLRPQTILGRFGNGGVPGLRQVPFRTALITQDTGGAGYWVGEGAAKPLTKFDFSRKTIAPLKVANIAVITDELMRDSSPSADMLVRDGLAAALRERMDTDFIDPAKAAAAGVSPASITNGVTAITSSGDTADDVRADVIAVMDAYITANNPPTSGVWIMNATTALTLSMMTTALGEPEFQGIGMNGGTFMGLPVITSEYVPAANPGPGALVILVNASDVYFADEGGIAVDMSREASLEMADNPTGVSGATPVAASLVSLWQTNSVGFRAERTLNWDLRRASGVQMLEDVTWAA